MIELQIKQRGIKFWRLNGLRHRANGPAIKYPSGYQAWWHHDRLHRLNGPARTYSNGEVEYWINGNRVSEYELMFMNESCV